MLTRGGEDTQASVELVAVAAFTFHHSPVFVHVTFVTVACGVSRTASRQSHHGISNSKTHSPRPDPITCATKPLRSSNLQICINQVAINSLGLHCIIK
jgi:hypothetical protein